MAAATSPAPATERPSIDSTRSPACRPASAGRPARHDVRDERAGARRRRRSSATPRYAALDRLAGLQLRRGPAWRCRSGSRSRRRELDCVEVAIWALMPTTLPLASSSGPPELPGLIAASVCTTLSIEKLFGASIERPSAEMTPVVSVPSSRNGLPIAIAGWPTLRSFDEPSASGVSLRPAGVDLQQREVRRGVDADDARGRPAAPGRAKRTRTVCAPSTTWSFVRM